MNKHDRENIWAPAAEALFENAQTEDFLLELALGCKLYTEYCSRPNTSDFPLTDEMRELLIKLAGPYGKAVLKAYRIKKGLE